MNVIMNVRMVIINRWEQLQIESRMIAKTFSIIITNQDPFFSKVGDREQRMKKWVGIGSIDYYVK